ncbi:MAG: hypothetical protein RLZ44_1050 [Pseudomonadota bacterium]
MNTLVKAQRAPGLWARHQAWYRGLSRGKRIIYVVFWIWAVQAIPKWTAAIVGDGETAAAIMTFFITPR